MPSYKRFEDLPVWKISADLAAKMMSWASQKAFRGKGDLANQLQRASLSISNNIAEGFERGSTKELLQFLYIARGSAGEVRSMLQVMRRMSEFEAMTEEINTFARDAENISRQIRGWANSLQNSDIAGAKFLNDSSRDDYERKIRRDAFEEKQKTFRREMEERLKADANRRNENDVGEFD